MKTDAASRHAAPRHIVITGASAGLGYALALAYAAPGVVLGLLGRDAVRLDACAAQCRARGALTVTACIDVRDALAVQNWLWHFDDAHPVDLLLANAGVAHTLAAPGDWEDLACIETLLRVNFAGALHAVLPLAGRMRLRGAGQIALVSSLAALRGMALSPAYCASKAALSVWAEAMRPLLACEGVRLTLILPGFVQTAMSERFPASKPWLWPADKAAQHIRRKLAAGCAEIAFPWPLAWGMRLLALLPVTLADALLARSYWPGQKRR
ncbi:SDR family NAD(P)-dependent oxidoreductase [Paraburkholderia bonniea]|uniref:SDR family NAD(P)-dependent oxidoreductase n=1 Tax=Paraburkholderia bonniea TaxID=2152891 RepID=UPI001290B07F|nr:SDR family NAD(P)-dependent oxidoreductase [Paraburkholderia bonniea]WJF90822.1 SDR family NAD(P)-dependent oxidoreductase [Paraburkholderia bonniea]WJF94136.1 SDR family NAD(P)-dependent oxidoreductase [Paraburkholderia bonniea]